MYAILPALFALLLPPDFGVTPKRAAENLVTGLQHITRNIGQKMPAGWKEDADWCADCWAKLYRSIDPETGLYRRLAALEQLRHVIGRDALDNRLMPPPYPTWHLGGIEPLGGLTPPSRRR